MKIITCDAIRKHNPCYDPATKLPEDYSGTVVDFLKQEQISAADRLWVARFFVTDKTNRLFAVWCARQALALVSNPDQRSVAACDVAERFANGAATKEELDAAARAAEAAAWAARVARAAESAAAWSAAWSAARAECSAAWESAWAAWAADAARAECSAAWESAWAAESAAARAECSAAQINYLITLIERDEP